MIQFSSLATAAGVVGINAAQLSGSLIRMQGYVRAGADCWLQVFDSIGAPAAGAVSLKSYSAPNAAPFHWAFEVDELPLATGLYIALSSTETTYTAVVAPTMDIFGEFEPRLFQPNDGSVSGDLATGRDSLQVWAEAAGPKTLYKVDYTNNDGATRYLMLFPKDASADGTIPLAEFQVLNGATLNLNFGDAGFLPNVLLQGMTIRQSSTAGVLTATASAVSYIRAYSK